MRFWGEVWLECADDNSLVVKLLRPIIHFVDNSEEAQEERRCMPRQKFALWKERLIEVLPSAVFHIREYWRNRNKETMPKSHFKNGAPIAATVQKLGRNAPCSCGSGKKYKKCCGQHANFLDTNGYRRI
jgi:uncharacterized protein YecA (UPF0149 family)